ncbi:hypothetical protein ACLX1H_001496 [Fusarium chlamydosporum]
MGIPRLISTLEPYVVHGVLDNERVVIDGPALAYHVLYICNRHGSPQPSYKVLGETTIAWLDELTQRGVSVDAIYFDGYLPPDKEPVRMQRMVKSLDQLKKVHSTETNGFFPAYFSSLSEASPTLFSAARPPVGKPTIPPSFHVPAIIDTLRLSSRYAELVHLVPGEADAYCAQHVSHSGGTVLTSDSDLLVHDLEKGSVVFLRDIYRDDQSHLACARFSPAHICEKLKLSSSEICRFAYERKSSPHSTLPQLLQDCARPISDQIGYNEFCQASLQKPVFKRVSWDTIHFVAHLQAAYYSFRLLKQVISLEQPKSILPELRDMLSSLPPLEECPNIESTIEFLQASNEARVYETVAKSVPLPNIDMGTKPKRTVKDKKRKIIKETSPKTKARVTKPGTRNMFDLLSHNS